MNTDFAQVEADEQQINLDRFNLFYPGEAALLPGERRALHDGRPRARWRCSSAAGSASAPRAGWCPSSPGGRMSGKAAASTSGVLNMQTRAVDGVVPGQQLHGGPGLPGAPQSLPRRGDLRQPGGHRGPGGVSGANNQTYGADGKWGIGRYSSIEGYVRQDLHARAVRPGLRLQRAAEHDSPAWLLSAGVHARSARTSTPTVGFLRARTTAGPRAWSSTATGPDDLLGLLRSCGPTSPTRGYWKPDGFQESG